MTFPLSANLVIALAVIVGTVSAARGARPTL